ncbi:MAG: AlbA family DNA-binding domain-containing protein, partial [Gammaproteobacteria bacterium]
ASLSGPRYIIFGVEESDDGHFQPVGAPANSAQEIQEYPAIIRQYIEPDIHAEILFGDVGGKFLVALEITNCVDQPYVIKTDVSRNLRRGDCWIAEGGITRPAQRLDLDRMYRHKASTNESGLIKVGINCDPSVNDAILTLPDLSDPPSRQAARVIKKEIDARQTAFTGASNEDTGLVRLVRTRLYGSEKHNDTQGLDTLIQGYNAVKEDHRDADQHYFFETNALKLNFCIQNNGIGDLEDVVLSLSFPRAREFRIAPQIFAAPDKELTPAESSLMGYPGVKEYKQAVQVKAAVGSIGPGEIVDSFEKALRIACRPALGGKKIAVQYELQASNLPQAQRGKLKIGFRK